MNVMELALKRKKEMEEMEGAARKYDEMMRRLDVLLEEGRLQRDMYEEIVGTMENEGVE